MMNRMNSGSIISQAGVEQREEEDAGDREAVRPEPAQVLAQVLAPLAAPGVGRAGCSAASVGSSSWRCRYFRTKSR